MKKLFWMGIVCLTANLSFAGSGWETDMDKALEKAKEENRYLLLDFTGSDWCGWCIKLDKEVFSKSAFEDYAKENLVLVELDFPRRKSIKKSLKEQNEKLMKEYGVTGFPTIFILDPSGNTVLRTGYRDGGPEPYVEHLDEAITKHRKENDIPSPQDKQAPTAKRAPSMFGVPYDSNRESRTWTSQSGSTIEASLLQEQGAHVVLKKDDGGKAKIRLSQLSDADQAYVNSLK